MKDNFTSIALKIYVSNVFQNSLLALRLWIFELHILIVDWVGPGFRSKSLEISNIINKMELVFI